MREERACQRTCSWRDLDLGAFNHLDGRRLEVVADGLSLFGGAQLAIDTTLVSALRRDGTATRGAANRNGAAIQAAHTDARRGRSRNLSGREVVPGWSHLQAKLVAGGRLRLPTF